VRVLLVDVTMALFCDDDDGCCWDDCDVWERRCGRKMGEDYLYVANKKQNID
jgi:hypothetical protein